MTRLEAYLGQIMTRFALNTHLNSSDFTVVGQVFALNPPSIWSKSTLPISKNRDNIATESRQSYQSVRFPCGNNVCPIVRISQVHSRTGIGYYNGLKQSFLAFLGYYNGLEASCNR